MLKAVIIDDVERARRTLGDDLAVYCPAVTVIGEASGVATGINLITRLKPDLVFLDIQLDDGTGFDLLEKIGPSDFKVIFTTALDSYGIKAIKFSALDYLLKPVDPDELIRAVDKATALLTPTTVRESVAVMFDALHGAQRRLALNTADRVHIVQLDEIIRCESQRNYTLFYLADKRSILVTRTLKEFDEILDGLGFFRIHHSHLVNIRYISEYVKTDGGYVVLSDGSTVPVAVRKKDALLQVLRVL